MERTAIRRAPVHRLAIAAIVSAAVAGVLALYGSLMAERHIDGSPLNVARNADGLEDTRTSPGFSIAIRLAAFVLPLVLGIGACLLGGEAMKAVEKSNGAYSGSLPSVFAMMIGGLAAVVAGCMTVAVFVWKHVPSLYPT
jgi:hypothetical protein